MYHTLTCLGGGPLELGPERQEGHVAKETVVVRVERGVVSLRGRTHESAHGQAQTSLYTLASTIY